MGDFNDQDNKDYRSDQTVEELQMQPPDSTDDQPVVEEDNHSSQYQQLKAPEYQKFNQTGQIQNQNQQQNQYQYLSQNQNQYQYQNHNQYQQYRSSNQMNSQGYYGQYNQPYQPRKQGMAIASMVLGIISLLTSCTIIIPIPTAIIGIILGIISIKYKYDGRGMAIAGIILSSISLLVVLLVIIGYIAFSNYWIDEFYREFNMDQYYRDYGSDIFDEFRYEFNFK